MKKQIGRNRLPELKAARIRSSGDNVYCRRLEALIKLATGAAPEDAARSAGTSVRSLQRWTRQFRRRGVDGLKTRPAAGRKPRLNARQSALVQSALTLPPSHFGYTQAKWTGALLSRHLRERHHTTLGVRQCRNLIRRNQRDGGGINDGGMIGRGVGLPPAPSCGPWTPSDRERKRLALARLRKLASAGAAQSDFVNALFDIVSDAVPDGEPKTLWLGPSLESGWICRNLDFAAWWPGAKRFIFDSESAVSGMRGPRELLGMQGNVLRPEQLMAANFRRGPAYNEVVRPLGLVSCAMMLLRDGNDFLGLYPLHRSASQPPFSADDLRFLDAAAPYVVHGIKAAQTLAKLRDGSSNTDQGETDCPGVILVNRSGRIISVSTEARNMFLELAAFDGVPHDLFLSEATRTATDYIGAILRDALFGEGFAPQAPPMARLYNHRSGLVLKLRGIATESNDACFTILIERAAFPEAECRRFRFRYGLSERESLVFMMLRKRLSDKEIAAGLRISPGTVRQYLRQLAFKLAVTGQSGVRRFAQLAT